MASGIITFGNSKSTDTTANHSVTTGRFDQSLFHKPIVLHVFFNLGIEKKIIQQSFAFPPLHRDFYKCLLRFLKITEYHDHWITTTRLHSAKPELWSCAGFNPAGGVSQTCDGENLQHWSRLESRLDATIPKNNSPSSHSSVALVKAFSNSF